MYVLERSADRIVKLKLAKDHLVVEGAQHDDLIRQYIDAATEAAESYTTRIAVPTTLRVSFEDWTDCLDLPVYPVRSISQVRYRDESDDFQTVDAGDYALDKTAVGGRVRLLDSFSSPRLGDGDGPIQVDILAGYDVPGAEGSPVDPALRLPASFRQAVLQTIAHWYRNRESVVSGTSAMDMPQSALDLLHGLRIFR